MPWTRSVRSWSPSDERHAASKIKDLIFQQTALVGKDGMGHTNATKQWSWFHATQKCCVTPHAWCAAAIRSWRTNWRRLLRRRVCRHHGQHCCCDQKGPHSLQGSLPARTLDIICMTFHCFMHFHDISARQFRCNWLNEFNRLTYFHCFQQFHCDSTFVFSIHKSQTRTLRLTL